MILESEYAEIFENLLTSLATTVINGGFAITVQCHEYGLTLDESDFLLRDILKMDDRRTISIHRSIRTSSSSNNNDEVVNSVSDEAKPVNGTKKSIDVDLDVTGTPLECPFDLNDQTISEDNESINRKDTSLENGFGNNSKLSILEASVFQTVVREFLVSDRDQFDADIKSFPFVIVCDGNDPKGTLFMGFRKVNSYLETFRVTCNGSVLLTDELPKLEKMVRHHSSGFSPRDSIETKAKAVYCILERANDDLQLKNQSNIEVTCEWNRINQVLEIPNGDATCNIKFEVSLGDVRSAAHDKFQELLLLQDLANGLITGEITWTTVQTESSVETDVIKLLEGLKMSGFKVKREYNKKNRNSDFGTFDLERQRNMDFTDKFWNVLKGSRSLNELTRCMNIILEAIQLREIKPVIFNSNRTSFGKIISNIAHRKGAVVPKLFGIEPLHMLVEMGIEKLKQDYAYILLSSGLVQKDSFDPFFTPKAVESIDWPLDLTALRKLHCTIELVSLCNTFVDPSHMILGAYARNVLNSLTCVSTVDSLMSFSFAVERKAMKSILERVCPLMWQVTMTSQQDSYLAQTVYRSTSSHPVHACTKSKKSKRSVVDNCCNLKEAAFYYMCIGTLVRDTP